MTLEEGFNPEQNSPETESSREVLQFLEQLDQEAERVGAKLEETDFIEIGTNEALKLKGKIEMILSALAIAAGFTIAKGASDYLLQPDPEQINAAKLMTRLGIAAVGGAGAHLMFKGVQKLQTGYRRLQGYISVKELKNLSDES